MVLGLQGGKNLSEASHRHLLDFPFHFQLQKVKVRLGGWFDTVWFDGILLILNGNVNKNYRLRCGKLGSCIITIFNSPFRIAGLQNLTLSASSFYLQSVMFFWSIFFSFSSGSFRKWSSVLPGLKIHLLLQWFQIHQQSDLPALRLQWPWGSISLLSSFFSQSRRPIRHIRKRCRTAYCGRCSFRWPVSVWRSLSGATWRFSGTTPLPKSQFLVR